LKENAAPVSPSRSAMSCTFVTIPFGAWAALFADGALRLRSLVRP
jgi:hypothetical protein